VSHPLLAALGDPDPRARQSACRRAAADPAAVVLLAALADAFGDSDASVALAAADAFAEIATASRAGDAELREALRAGSPQRRAIAAVASARIAPPSPRWIPPLVDGLGSGAGALRWRALAVLVQCAPALPEVLPLLRGLATDGDATPRVREMAVHGVREAEHDPGLRSEVLARAAGDPDAGVRRAALLARSAERHRAPAAETSSS
jgi:hypothetical protein